MVCPSRARPCLLAAEIFVSCVPCCLRHCTSITMLAPSLAILRRSAASSSRIVGAARHLTGGSANISVDHYSSGWKIDDIADFTKEGKFHIKTYNKISEEVRT